MLESANLVIPSRTRAIAGNKENEPESILWLVTKLFLPITHVFRSLEALWAGGGKGAGCLQLLRAGVNPVSDPVTSGHRSAEPVYRVILSCLRPPEPGIYRTRRIAFKTNGITNLTELCKALGTTLPLRCVPQTWSHQHLLRRSRAPGAGAGFETLSLLRDALGSQGGLQELRTLLPPHQLPMHCRWAKTWLGRATHKQPSCPAPKCPPTHGWASPGVRFPRRTSRGREDDTAASWKS